MFVSTVLYSRKFASGDSNHCRLFLLLLGRELTPWAGWISPNVPIPSTGQVTAVFGSVIPNANGRAQMFNNSCPLITSFFSSCPHNNTQAPKRGLLSFLIPSLVTVSHSILQYLAKVLRKKHYTWFRSVSWVFPTNSQIFFFFLLRIVFVRVRRIYKRVHSLLQIPNLILKSNSSRYWILTHRDVGSNHVPIYESSLK